MKNINIEERERILSQPYISADGYYRCLPIGLSQAKKLFREDEQKCIDEGIQLFDTRPRVIPTSFFIRQYVNGRRKKA